MLKVVSVCDGGADGSNNGDVQYANDTPGFEVPFGLK